MGQRFNPYTGEIDYTGEDSGKYNSAEDPSTESIAVGGIKTPTKLSDIQATSGGTISGVIDMILFPENQPTVSQPSVSLSTSKAKVVEVGAPGYVAADFTVTNKRGSVSHAKENGAGTTLKNQPYAGEVVTAESFIYANTEANKVALEAVPATFPAGVTKYYAKSMFAAGVAVPVTNKGNASSYAAYKKAAKVSAAVSIEAFYPIYVGRVSESVTADSLTSELIRTGTKQLGKPGTITVTGSEVKSHAFVALPALSSLESKYLWSIKKVLDQNGFDNTTAFEPVTVNVTTDNGITIPYKVYFNPTANSGAALVYTVTLN